MEKNKTIKTTVMAITFIMMTIATFGLLANVHATIDPPSPIISQKTTIEIINNLDTELTFKEKSRQAIQIVTEPPKEVKAGDKGSFEVKPGDSVKNEHLNVKYYVGTSGSSEDIAFGVNDNGCFTDTPTDISGSHDGCGDSTIKYIFKSK